MPFSGAHNTSATVEDGHKIEGKVHGEAPAWNDITHKIFCSDGIPRAAGEHQVTTAVEMSVT